MEKLGKILWQARIEKGITLRKMAEELGISAMYISEIENSKKTPLRGDTLPRMAAYLGLDPGEIIKMAFAEKTKTRVDGLEDSLSLAVARKALEVKDEEMLKKIMKIFEGVEIERN